MKFFFDSRQVERRHSGILKFFSPFIRIFTGFFVNLWKHNGNSFPTDALKSWPVSKKNNVRAASYGQYHISYYGGCSHEHCKLCFPAHESKIVPRKTLAM